MKTSLFQFAINLFYSLKSLRVNNKHSIDEIPEGPYCYTCLSIEHRSYGPVMKIKQCPFWDRSRFMPHQENGYCHLLRRGDWNGNNLGLLWDQCKECGIKDGEEE